MRLDVTPDARNQSGARVPVGVALPAVFVIVGLAIAAVGWVRERAHDPARELQQVAQALISYSADNGRLPPAAVYGVDGKPLLSWRVLILPYLKQDELYRQFRLDEPWDSPHNLRLLPQMPRFYTPSPGRRKAVARYHTACHVFYGRGAAFEGKQGLRIPEDFLDGTSDTILLIEAGKPVPWTKPEELPFDPDGPLPDLEPLFNGGFRVALADGSTRFVDKGISEQTLRLLIQRDDGAIGRGDW
jgi:hypothetical protein